MDRYSRAILLVFSTGLGISILEFHRLGAEHHELLQRPVVNRKLADCPAHGVLADDVAVPRSV